LPIDFLTGAIRETAHRVDDDLLTAGLGLAGLRAAAPAFLNSGTPTAAELRRRAIHANWNGIADLGPLGAHAEAYGSTAHVPGREYQAFARIPGARWPHRVLVQIPDDWDAQARCLVVSASSGSRGIYGAIALAGAWGLPRGCAVAYTDKGCGTGYFDTAAATGSALDGTQSTTAEADLEFAPEAAAGDAGIAVKHAHSGDNPEADWGRHVLQAARFGLAMLERAMPQHAPFTPQNTRVIAVGLSNGGGAVLRAAGLDEEGVLAGVVALAPNISAPVAVSRPLYDYATEAALLLPCALTDPLFDAVPFARIQGHIAPMWIARGAGLRAARMLQADEPRAQAAEALARLRASGWNDAALATAASTTAFDVWRAIAVTYASAYVRAGVGDMPNGFRFSAHDSAGKPRAALPSERAAWWADASGVPPGAGVFLDESPSGDPADPGLRGLLRLRELWTGSGTAARTLRDSVAATVARLPRQGLPIFVVHGREDGLLPIALSSDPYVDWLRANECEPLYWPIAHAQHFDAFLALPGFGDRHVPLLPYGYAALDRMWQHVVTGAALSPADTPVAAPRGAGRLEASRLGLSAIRHP